MGLRLQDPIPKWITHIALVQGGYVKNSMLHCPIGGLPRSITFSQYLAWRNLVSLSALL
jgi:hypothetical protein